MFYFVLVRVAWQIYRRNIEMLLLKFMRLLSAGMLWSIHAVCILQMIVCGLDPSLSEKFITTTMNAPMMLVIINPFDENNF